MDDRIGKLSPRHRDVLRLAREHFTTDEIATKLGIASGTAAGYVAEAMRALGARTRGEAVRIFNEIEPATPANSGGMKQGVDRAPTEHPSPPRDTRQASILGPLSFLNREADNDLGVTARIAWTLILAAVVAVGLLVVVSSVRSVNDLVIEHRRGR